MANRNDFGVLSLVLGSAVATAGTFDVAYPTGTTQLSFLAGLAGSTHYAVVNSNDRYTAAAGYMSASFGASVITVTNSSGVTWAAGSKVDLYFEQNDGNSRIPFTFPIAALSGVAAGDVVTEIRPGIAGTVEAWEFVVGTPVTTAAKTATFNLEIDTTNVTAGTLVVTSALATPMGKSIAGAAITGANTLTRDSKLSIEAATVTAFVEGNGYFIVYIRPTPNVPSI